MTTTLVGSRKPLDIINATGLKDMVCTAAHGSACTWRGLEADASFWPGRSDLASTAGFASVNGRVFDTGRMSDTALQQLGLAGEESAASDHLMLVVDYETGDLSNDSHRINLMTVRRLQVSCF